MERPFYETKYREKKSETRKNQRHSIKFPSETQRITSYQLGLYETEHSHEQK